VERVFLGDAPLHDRLELGERFSRQGIDIPGLQIAARGRARGASDQVLDDAEIDRLVEEGTAGNARVDRFKDVHECSLLLR
jgi:hypothetical protein